MTIVGVVLVYLATIFDALHQHLMAPVCIMSGCAMLIVSTALAYKNHRDKVIPDA